MLNFATQMVTKAVNGRKAREIGNKESPSQRQSPITNSGLGMDNRLKG